MSHKTRYVLGQETSLDNTGSDQTTLFELQQGFLFCLVLLFLFLFLFLFQEQHKHKDDTATVGFSMWKPMHQ